tara:strand:+ start:248 stop:352 length:105 start_codon:yes stop_codon:yes gene_type:complete
MLLDFTSIAFIPFSVINVISAYLSTDVRSFNIAI